MNEKKIIQNKFHYLLLPYNFFLFLIPIENNFFKTSSLFNKLGIKNQCRLVKKFLRLSGVFHLTKRGLSGENT